MWTWEGWGHIWGFRGWEVSHQLSSCNAEQPWASMWASLSSIYP